MAARGLEDIPRMANQVPSRPGAGTAVWHFSEQDMERPGRRPAITRREVANTLVGLTASANQCSLCSLCTA